MRGSFSIMAVPILLLGMTGAACGDERIADDVSAPLGNAFHRERVVLNGRAYPDFIRTGLYAVVHVNGWDRFRTVVGLPSGDSRATVDAAIKTRDRTLWQGTLRAGTSRSVDVDLRGVDQVILSATDRDVVFAQPRLYRSGGFGSRFVTVSDESRDRQPPADRDRDRQPSDERDRDRDRDQDRQPPADRDGDRDRQPPADRDRDRDRQPPADRDRDRDRQPPADRDRDRKPPADRDRDRDRDRDVDWRDRNRDREPGPYWWWDQPRARSRWGNNRWQDNRYWDRDAVRLIDRMLTQLRDRAGRAIPRAATIAILPAQEQGVRTPWTQDQIRSLLEDSAWFIGWRPASRQSVDRALRGSRLFDLSLSLDEVRRITRETDADLVLVTQYSRGTRDMTIRGALYRSGERRAVAVSEATIPWTR